MLTYDLPLAEVIYDLHDKLKSSTRGYGTMDYELRGYEPSGSRAAGYAGQRQSRRRAVGDLRSQRRRTTWRAVAKKLKSEIDRHMFEVAVQAAIGTRVIARETVPALRKNVTAKCYGGDITRKRKLWAKQTRRKETYEIDRPGRHSAESLHGGIGYRRRKETLATHTCPALLVADSIRYQGRDRRRAPNAAGFLAQSAGNRPPPLLGHTLLRAGAGVFVESARAGLGHLWLPAIRFALARAVGAGD